MSRFWAYFFLIVLFSPSFSRTAQAVEESLGAVRVPAIHGDLYQCLKEQVLVTHQQFVNSISPEEAREYPIQPFPQAVTPPVYKSRWIDGESYKFSNVVQMTVLVERPSFGNPRSLYLLELESLGGDWKFVGRTLQNPGYAFSRSVNRFAKFIKRTPNRQLIGLVDIAPCFEMEQ